jgi:hypothetical protein
MLSMDVDDSRLRSVLAVVRAHWARLAAGEFDPGALSQVKWHMSTSASLRYQTSTELALRTIEALNLGWSLEALGHGVRTWPASRSATWRPPSAPAPPPPPSRSSATPSASARRSDAAQTGSSTSSGDASILRRRAMVLRVVSAGRFLSMA